MIKIVLCMLMATFFTLLAGIGYDKGSMGMAGSCSVVAAMWLIAAMLKYLKGDEGNSWLDRWLDTSNII